MAANRIGTRSPTINGRRHAILSHLAHGPAKRGRRKNLNQLNRSSKGSTS